MSNFAKLRRDRPKRQSHFEVEVPLELVNPSPEPARGPQSYLPKGFTYVDVKIPSRNDAVQGSKFQQSRHFKPLNVPRQDYQQPQPQGYRKHFDARELLPIPPPKMSYG